MLSKAIFEGKHTAAPEKGKRTKGLGLLRRHRRELIKLKMLLHIAPDSGVPGGTDSAAPPEFSKVCSRCRRGMAASACSMSMSRRN